MSSPVRVTCSRTRRCLRVPCGPLRRKRELVLPPGSPNSDASALRVPCGPLRRKRELVLPPGSPTSDVSALRVPCVGVTCSVWAVATEEGTRPPSRLPHLGCVGVTCSVWAVATEEGTRPPSRLPHLVFSHPTVFVFSHPTVSLSKHSSPESPQDRSSCSTSVWAVATAEGTRPPYRLPHLGCIAVHCPPRGCQCAVMPESCSRTRRCTRRCSCSRTRRCLCPSTAHQRALGIAHRARHPCGPLRRRRALALLTGSPTSDASRCTAPPGVVSAP